MNEYIFGANILENLTTGMYQDSKVIYREYIQNACDQIDKAVKNGFMKPDECAIQIWLSRDDRTIVIEDNAIGLPASLFQSTLGNIADSNKRIGEDKGFRGIGRLCGLAYCKELIFESSAIGEVTRSILVCNAGKMRELIEENARGIKHTANEVLNAINRFETQSNETVESHYFRVKLIGINGENTDLLDFQKVKSYLSFVAPVPYQSTFIYRNEIYRYADKLGIKIDEYNIILDGETVFKKYTTVLKDSSGVKYDDVFGVYFRKFYDEDGELLSWMWIGLSKFQKAIPRINQMRGLRLRKENIQIGGEDALQKLFNEDRGNNYFIGEVFGIHRDLIPNSQRDYFNENPARAEFERTLKGYFNKELRKVYYDGSAVNSAYKKLDVLEKKKSDFKDKMIAGAFVDEAHRDRELKALQDSEEEAVRAREKIEKMRDKANDLLIEVIQKIEAERPKAIVKSVVKEREENKPLRRTDKLSQYNKKERKLISRIFSLILTSTDCVTAETIISKIEEGL